MGYLLVGVWGVFIGGTSFFLLTQIMICYPGPLFP